MIFIDRSFYGQTATRSPRSAIDTNETSESLFCGNCRTAILSGDVACRQCSTQVQDNSDLKDLIGDYVPYCRACGVPVAKEATLYCTKCWLSPLCPEHFYPSTRSCLLCTAGETAEEPEQLSLSRSPAGPWPNPIPAAACPKCGTHVRQEVEFCPNCGMNNRVIKEADFAGFFPRIGAAIIDSLPSLVITGILFPVIDIPGIFLLLLVGYHTFFTYKKGRTLGKMVLGIKVMNINREPPTVKQILLREVLGKLLIFFTLFIGFIWIIWDPKRRGWHDYISGTYVTHTKRDYPYGERN